MTTNDPKGRAAAVIVGIYFIAKALLNFILGGSFWDIIIAAVEGAVLYTGLMYTNYVISVIVAIVVLRHLKGNITNIGSNWIYLLEGIIDLFCVFVLCAGRSVRRHFTKSWSEFLKIK